MILALFLLNQKFGIYEGKPSKELMKVARKDSYHSWTDFNPPGGETVEEVGTLRD